MMWWPELSGIRSIGKASNCRVRLTAYPTPLFPATTGSRIPVKEEQCGCLLANANVLIDFRKAFVVEVGAKCGQ